MAANDRNLADAMAAYSRGLFAEVVDRLEPVLEKPDVAPTALACLGLAFFRLRKYARSVACWEKLLERDLPSHLAARVRMNLARASYMAAEPEVREGHFEVAAKLLKTYSDSNRGDEEAQRIFASVQKLRGLSEAVADVRSARELADAASWEEAAKRLMGVRDRIVPLLIDRQSDVES
jgi:tetratricopeptide (TPR) repeat protein